VERSAKREVAEMAMRGGSLKSDGEKTAQEGSVADCRRGRRGKCLSTQLTGLTAA
jgi:hypothetical protein